MDIYRSMYWYFITDLIKKTNKLSSSLIRSNSRWVYEQRGSDNTPLSVQQVEISDPLSFDSSLINKPSSILLSILSGDPIGPQTTNKESPHSPQVNGHGNGHRKSQRCWRSVSC
mmetsp:Transcript_25860/g.33657  ORF Transcript_25860/g.33657 Transcript_25860/m.33657 type:complete len:114 (-) Transcript_25860:191-532(-)